MYTDMTATNFFQDIFIGALTELDQETQTSSSNGYWLWTDNPINSFKTTDIQSIKIHADDIIAFGAKIVTKMANQQPESQIFFGIYINGLRAPSENISSKLLDFLSLDQVTNLCVHHAAEISGSPNYGITLSKEAMTQQELTHYYSYMGNSRLIGISVPGAQGLPQWCREVANRVSYFQLLFTTMACC